MESVFKKLENSPEAEVLLGQTSNYGVTNALMAAVRFVVVALLGLVMIVGYRGNDMCSSFGN